MRITKKWLDKWNACERGREWLMAQKERDAGKVAKKLIDIGNYLYMICELMGVNLKEIMLDKLIEVENRPEWKPNELDQISSKEYGADGVGLTHAEVDALAEPVEPVKTEAIEKLLSEYCSECGDCCEICVDMKAVRAELEAIRRGEDE